MGRDMLLARAVRSGIERRDEKNMLEKEITLPGLPGAQSQLVMPLLAHNKLLGVLCLQGQTPGQFLASDERVMQIASRHLAVSMSSIRLAVTADHTIALRPSHKGVLSKRNSVVNHYKSDDSIFIDDAYLIKGVAGRLLWKLLQASLLGIFQNHFHLTG
jgi:adenylate cyclase